MSEIRTGLGEVFTLERRLPRLGWKPKTRELANGSDFLGPADFGGDDVFGLIVGAIVAIIAIAVLIPLLLFVAEVALLVALVIPVTILALVVGLKRHTVQLTRKADGITVDRREVRGIYGSFRAGRELRSAAERGAYLVKSVAPSGATTAVGPPR